MLRLLTCIGRVLCVIALLACIASMSPTRQAPHSFKQERIGP